MQRECNAWLVAALHHIALSSFELDIGYTRLHGITLYHTMLCQAMFSYFVIAYGGYGTTFTFHDIPLYSTILYSTSLEVLV